jgi:membrane fusion protein (multidrug efflux system)
MPLWLLCRLLFLWAIAACDSNNDSNGVRGRPQQQTAPAEVGVVSVTPKTIPVTFEAVGQTEGSREVEVRSRVSGILLNRFYAEGKWVKQGTRLFKIDPAPFQAALTKAEGVLGQELAQLAKAARDAERLKPLYEANAVSRKEYEDAVAGLQAAQARVQSARAAVTEAKLNLDYTNVTAPITGVTGRAEKSEGSLVAAVTDLLTRISQVDPIYAYFTYSERDLLRAREEIAEGRLVLPDNSQFRVELRLADGSSYPETGKLNFNDLRVRPGTGSIEARAVFANPKTLLLSGQFVRVLLHGATRPNAILVPQQAVLSAQNGKTVYVVDASGKVEARNIETGEWEGTDFLVTSGLKPGDRIVVSGIMNLRPGMVVKPVPAGPQV